MNTARPVIRASRSAGAIQATRAANVSASAQTVAVIRPSPTEVATGPARRASVQIVARRSVVEHVVSTGAPAVITLATELRSSFIADVALDALRVVRALDDGSVIYASADDAPGADAIQGITRHAVGAGVQVSVQRVGKLASGAWAWTPEAPVFLGYDGQLTQGFDPGADFWVQIGTAITPTIIDVRIERPVYNNGGGIDRLVSLSGDGHLEAKAPGYQHVQNTPAKVWHVTHDLNRYPAGIAVVSSSGELVEGAITYVDANHVDLKFSWPFSGRAYLN